MEEILHTIVLILHVVGASLIIGVAFVTFIVEIKKYASKQVLELVELIWKIAGVGMGVQLLTGLYLAASEWETIGKMQYFWVKMFLFFIVGGTVRVINRRQFKEIQGDQKKRTTNISLALIGLLVFMVIAILGVLIAETAMPES